MLLQNFCQCDITSFLAAHLVLSLILVSKIYFYVKYVQLLFTYIIIYQQKNHLNYAEFKFKHFEKIIFFF